MKNVFFILVPAAVTLLAACGLPVEDGINWWKVSFFSILFIFIQLLVWYKNKKVLSEHVSAQIVLGLLSNLSADRQIEGVTSTVLTICILLFWVIYIVFMLLPSLKEQKD